MVTESCRHANQRSTYKNKNLQYGPPECVTIQPDVAHSLKSAHHKAATKLAAYAYDFHGAVSPSGQNALLHVTAGHKLAADASPPGTMQGYGRLPHARTFHA